MAPSVWSMTRVRREAEEEEESPSEESPILTSTTVTPTVDLVPKIFGKHHSITTTSNSITTGEC